MTPNSRRRTKTARAIVAIAAAYAFVLQVLLLSLMASQAAAAGHNTDAYVICVGTGDNSAADPAQVPAKVHCSLLCAQAMSAAAPAPSTVSLGFVYADSTVLTPAPVATVGVRAPPSPRLSQGPPQIA